MYNINLKRKKVSEQKASEQVGEHRIPTNEEYEAHRQKHSSSSEARVLQEIRNAKEAADPDRFVIVRSRYGWYGAGRIASREVYGTKTYSWNQVRAEVERLNSITNPFSKIWMFQSMSLEDLEHFGI